MPPRRSPFARSMRGRWAGLLLLILTAIAGRVQAAPMRATHDRRVDELVGQARQWLSTRTIEARRMAIRDLEDAIAIAPDRGDALLLLARAYEQAGFQRLAQQTWARASTLAPDDATARAGLALAWRRDYLKYLERASLDRAVEQYRAATRLDSSDVQSWLALSCLAIERGDLTEALAAAQGASRTGRSRAEASLAAASACWRLGQVEAADSLFRDGIGHVRRSVRERYDDLAPLASERDTMVFNALDADDRETFRRRFWNEHDPDLATPENEARLEYWARVTQAYLLYFDARRRAWDERGEVYVRYGPPARATYNPLGVPLRSDNPGRTAGNQASFPLNVLVWEYPVLGLRVVMHDRSLNEQYELPVSLDTDPDPIPSPDSVATSGLLATHGLRGMFPVLPPGVRPLEVRAQWARFEGVDGRPRLFVAAATPAGPADTLMAEFVVLDSLMHPVARSRRPLSPSACDATSLRTATFEAGLAPGTYLVGVSLHGEGRRGARREVVECPASDSTLAVSDLVLTCGLPLAGESQVRLDPNPDAVVTGDDPLIVYFEAHHLTLGPEGEARFEYETAVRPLERDTRIWFQRWLAPRREGQGVGVTRQDEVRGSLRRQFVRVPAQGLAPGRYRLDVVVRDLLSGAEVRRSATFTRRATGTDSGSSRTP